MALTDLEKAQNKAARLVRDRAHRARVALLRQAVARAAIDPDVLQAKAAYEQAAREGQKLLDQRNLHIGALKTKIHELELRLEKYQNDRQELIDAKAHSSGLAIEWHNKLNAKVHEVEAAFQDLSGDARYAVSNWKVPQDVQDEMQRAWLEAGKADTKKKEGPQC